MGPSILTSHLCAVALYLNSEYLHVFTEYCHMTSSRSLVEILEITWGMCKTHCTEGIGQKKSKSLPTGKISLASEPAGKTRLFAIPNFWVQSALKPLHNQLMLALKLFNSDGTFDQIAQFNRIVKETKGIKTYCFDLSKATDRFPIKLQQAVLELLVSKEFAKC